MRHHRRATPGGIARVMVALVLAVCASELVLRFFQRPEPEMPNPRLEWMLASFGTSAAGGVVVPVYPTNSPHECEWVAGNSEAKAVICEDEGQRQKIDQVRDNLDQLAHVIGIEAGGGDQHGGQPQRRGSAGGEVSDNGSRGAGRGYAYPRPAPRLFQKAIVNWLARPLR